MKLRIKFILYFNILTLILIGGLVYYAYIETEKIIENQIRSGLTSLAATFENQSFLFFEKLKTQTADWASDGYIRREFEKIVKNPSDEQINILAEYIKSYKHSLSSEIIITDIFDLNGRVIVSTNKDRLGHTEDAEELNEEYSYDVAKLGFYGATFLTPPALEEGEAGHEIHKYMWHISIPLVSLESGKNIGVVVNHIPSEKINDILSGKWLVKGDVPAIEEINLRYETGEIYLVKSDSSIVTPSRFIGQEAIGRKAEVESVRECLKNGNEFFGKYINYLSDSVIGASRCISDYNLVLLVEVAEQEIFGPLQDEIKRFIFGGMIIWLIGVAIAYLFSSVLLKDIFAINEAAAEVAKNDLTARVNIKSKDEIGDLAETFNKMVENIARSQNELKFAQSQLKETNLYLETRIKDRTTELIKLKNNLEKIVLERTKELHEKVAELEKFKQLTVGREMKMIELKKKIEELRREKEE